MKGPTRILKPAAGARPAQRVSAPVRETLRGPGRPLDAGTRAFMEARFGHDFGAVRIHTERAVASSARALDAKAYTVGEHIVFNSDYYAPGTQSGLRLLAHELAHVVQQSRGGPTPTGAPDAAIEAGAEQAAAAVASGAASVQVSGASGVGVARQDDLAPPERPRRTPWQLGQFQPPILPAPEVTVIPAQGPAYRRPSILNPPSNWIYSGWDFVIPPAGSAYLSEPFGPGRWYPPFSLPSPAEGEGSSDTRIDAALGRWQAENAARLGKLWRELTPEQFRIRMKEEYDKLKTDGLMSVISFEEWLDIETEVAKSAAGTQTVVAPRQSDTEWVLKEPKQQLVDWTAWTGVGLDFNTFDQRIGNLTVHRAAVPVILAQIGGQFGHWGLPNLISSDDWWPIPGLDWARGQLLSQPSFSLQYGNSPLSKDYRQSVAEQLGVNVFNIQLGSKKQPFFEFAGQTNFSYTQFFDDPHRDALTPLARDAAGWGLGGQALFRLTPHLSTVLYGGGGYNFADKNWQWQPFGIGLYLETEPQWWLWGKKDSK